MDAQDRKIGDQEATVTHLQAMTEKQQKEFESKIALQQMEIAALTAGLQKVSAEITMKKPATPVAASRP